MPAMSDDAPDTPPLRPETLAAQGLGWIEPVTGAVTPPIHTATTYARDERYERIGKAGYTRDDNPTYDQVEALATALDGGAAAALFASGMAAATTVFQALGPGDHVVVPEVLYFGLPKWLREHATRWGLAVSFVPTADLDALASAVRAGETRLVWIETPANPIWAVTDIAAAAEIAHAAGARLAVDSTAATPVLTRPIELGADLVMHSATKYLNGHGDVLAGVLVSAREDELWARIKQVRFLAGPVLGPFEAWLLLRGLRTLFLRVRASAHNAMAVARHFEGHPALAAVLYPGLTSHPGHAVAARQMQGGFGGMLSLRLNGSEAAAMVLLSRVRLFRRATSLGGVESLIEHRATIEGTDSAVPRDLLRLSIGIEDADDLIADLEQALAGL
jgi:cystathionine gamma-synthase